MKMVTKTIIGVFVVFAVIAVVLTYFVAKNRQTSAIALDSTSGRGLDTLEDFNKRLAGLQLTVPIPTSGVSDQKLTGVFCSVSGLFKMETADLSRSIMLRFSVSNYLKNDTLAQIPAGGGLIYLWDAKDVSSRPGRFFALYQGSVNCLSNPNRIDGTGIDVWRDKVSGIDHADYVSYGIDIIPPTIPGGLATVKRLRIDGKDYHVVYTDLIPSPDSMYNVTANSAKDFRF